MHTAPKEHVDAFDGVEATPTYGIEFFHIYTDEEINASHEASLEYMKQLESVWKLDYHRILFMDNYNPTEHKLGIGDVLGYLEQNDARPDFWAYEGDVTSNADLLLKSLTSAKLQNSYLKYIEKHNKYPCSLLTASWYLTRLGMLPYANVIHGVDGAAYVPVSRLINILPQDYKPVEARAMELIRNSVFSTQCDAIQDLFFPMSSGREITLW